ncbi:four helix bundle protein [bacterium]|nr:four helix bundle protein [bacterium]
MNDNEENVKDKSYRFALRIIKLYRFLYDKKSEYVLSKQILRSGTSIGANIEEASAGQSRRDFLAKMSIASKEARETLYWLKLLRDSNYLEDKLAKSLIDDTEELVKMLTSIVKTTQKSIKKITKN